MIKISKKKRIWKEFGSNLLLAYIENQKLFYLVVKQVLQTKIGHFNAEGCYHRSMEGVLLLSDEGNS